MQYFKIAYGLIANKFISVLFVSIEIAALMLLANIVTATYNSKSLLLKPYEELLQNDGVILDVNSLLWEEGKAPEEVIKDIKSNCQGDVTIHYVNSMDFVARNGPASTMFYDEGSNIEYYLLEDDIFSKLRMPLAEGRWASSEKTPDDEIEIVISQGTDAQLGQVYVTPAGKIKIVGILTENTYVPPMGGVRSASINEQNSIFTYYDSFDVNVNLMGAFAIADKKLFPNQGDDESYNITADGLWFVSFGNNLTEEQIKYNTDYLKTIGYISPDETFHTLLDSSQKTINNIYLRMLPIIIAAVIVVLLGLIGTISLSTLRNMRCFGIFFLCGCSWGKILKIISAYLTYIFAAAIVWFIIGVNIMNGMKLAYSIGLSFDTNNIFISIIILLFMYLTAIILPYSLIKTTSPVETIKESV